MRFEPNLEVVVVVVVVMVVMVVVVTLVPNGFYSLKAVYCSSLENVYYRLSYTVVPICNHLTLFTAAHFHFHFLPHVNSVVKFGSILMLPTKQSSG